MAPGPCNGGFVEGPWDGFWGGVWGGLLEELCRNFPASAFCLVPHQQHTPMVRQMMLCPLSHRGIPDKARYIMPEKQPVMHHINIITSREPDMDSSAATSKGEQSPF